MVVTLQNYSGIRTGSGRRASSCTTVALPITKTKRKKLCAAYGYCRAGTPQLESCARMVNRESRFTTGRFAISAARPTSCHTVTVTVRRTQRPRRANPPPSVCPTAQDPRCAPAKGWGGGPWGSNLCSRVSIVPKTPSTLLWIAPAKGLRPPKPPVVARPVHTLGMCHDQSRD